MDLLWNLIEDLPELAGEVLCYGRNGEFLVGYCSKQPDGTYECEAEGTVLEDVTHYLELYGPRQE